jgi:hypothetical protein
MIGQLCYGSILPVIEVVLFIQVADHVSRSGDDMAQTARPANIIAYAKA